MSSNITAHSAKWSDLPLFPAGQWVATGEDIEAWNDLVYMRALVDAIEDQMKPLLNSSCVGDQFAAARQIRAAEQFPYIEFSFSQPWPNDDAAELLAAWRAEPKVVAA